MRFVVDEFMGFWQVMSLEVCMPFDSERFQITHARDHQGVLAVFRFLNQHGKDLLRSGPVPLPRPRDSRLFLELPTRVFVVLDRETLEVVACTFLACHPTCRGLVGDIDYVLTHPEKRGQGFARALMEKILSWVRTYRVDKIYKLQLVSEPERVAARGLYESLGFELVEGSDRHYALKL